MNTKQVLSFAMFFALAGCASQSYAERKVDYELAKEPPVTSRAELNGQAKSLINSMSGLTSEQKNQLEELRVSVVSQSSALRNRSLALRSILIRTVLSSSYDAQEVAAIKNRLQKVEEQRVSLILDASVKANKILGRDDDRKSLDYVFDAARGDN